MAKHGGIVTSIGAPIAADRFLFTRGSKAFPLTQERVKNPDSAEICTTATNRLGGRASLLVQLSELAARRNRSSPLEAGPERPHERAEADKLMPRKCRLTRN
ncbi:hypothetical protein KM043_002735 [Ampulex compressa]|nr:hypothetical protein KM043_002735 [Ampulex compressa]